MALQDRLAEHDLPVAVGKGGEGGGGGGEVAGRDVVVEGPEELLEGVGEALVVPARIVDEAPRVAESSAGSRIRLSLARSRWPIHSSLGDSLYQESACFDPAISKRRQFLRPAVTCETQSIPRPPPRKRSITPP